MAEPPAPIVYERFFAPRYITPIPVSALSAQDGALCMRGVPSTSSAQSWLPALTATTAHQMWSRTLTPAGMFDDPLIDDAFSGLQQCTTLSLRRALSEMSRALNGVFCIPNAANDGGWQFSNRAFSPLVWSVLTLMVDRGDHVRLRMAVRQGMPESTRHLAAAVVARVHVLIDRALTKVGPEELTMDQLDAQLRTFGFGSNCSTILFPVPGQLVVLRPSAAKALASVLLSCKAWTPETLLHAPLAMLSALAALEAPGVACIYGPRNAAGILAAVRSQARCAIGPPSDQIMDGRVHQLEAQTLQLFVMGWNLLLLGHADFPAALAARSMVWSDEVAKYATGNLMNPSTAPSAWRAAAYADFVAAITTARLPRYPVPLALTGDLEHRLRLLRTNYGPGASLELLLSCSPLGIRSKASARTLVPPISPVQVWRRVWRTSFVLTHPVVVDATIDDVQEFMRHQAPLIQQQSVPLDILRSNAARRVDRVLVYGCGPGVAERFAGAIAAFRLMAIPYGDTEWNSPNNFVVSSDALLVDAQAARPMMLRSLMARIYGRPDALFHVPFITPIFARELYTLCEMPDHKLRTETASALCDLLASMLRLQPPTKGISSGRTLMTYADINIRLAGQEQPWPLTLCNAFLPLFLGTVTQRYFERSLLVGSPVLYNGYLNTMLAMMRSPLDENAGFWHWPTDVLEVILRYFFLIYMQQQGLIGGLMPVPGIMENNRVLVQALAFLYVHKKMDRADLVRVVMPDDDDNGRGNGADYSLVPRGFSKRTYERVHPEKPREFTWKHLQRCHEHTMELGTLEQFPMQGNSIYHDLASATAAYAQASTIPTSIAAGAYSSLQFKQTMSETSVRGSRNSVRSILRVVGHTVDTMTPASDLARGMVEVSGTTDDTASYVPRPKGWVKRGNQCVDKNDDAAEAEKQRDANDKKKKKKKKKDKRSSAVVGANRHISDDETNTDVNGSGDDVIDDDDPTFDATYPIHKRVRNGQYNAALLHSSSSSSSSSSAAAAAAAIDMFSSPEEIAQYRRSHGKNALASNKKNAKESPEVIALRERAAKLRSDRAQNLHYIGACLSRFVVIAVTAVAASSDDTLPVSFVRAVLGTAYAPYGAGCRGFSWESSAHNARNHLKDIETSVLTVTRNARTVAMPRLYSPPDTPPVQPSSITDHVVNSLFDAEIAPWVSRGAILRNNADMSLLHNKVPGVNSLANYRQWDVPMSSTMPRGAAGLSSPVYAYSMELEVDRSRVREVARPHATFSESSSRDRGAQDLDAPYDFSMSVWMWRTLPREPTEYRLADATGLETAASVCGVIQSYSQQKAT